MENEFLLRLNNPDRPVICIGVVYTISFTRDGYTQYRKLKAVGKYEHFVMFENEKGYRECIDWWSLARCIA